MRVRAEIVGSVGSAREVNVNVTPPPPGPPRGTIVAADNCTLSTQAAIDRVWYAFTGVSPSRVEHHTTGGPSTFWMRRFTLQEGDRGPNDPVGNERVEFGRAGSNNTQPAFHYFREGERSVTWTWNRLPNIPLDSINGRTIFQWKHVGPETEVSTSPPLSLQQFAGGQMGIKERAGDYNGRIICRFSAETNRWWELAADITYDDPGQITLWLRYDGEANHRIVAAASTPTLKRHTGGGLMTSTPRVGVYQPAGVQASWRDLGPTRIERIA
jgi:hypothetical protein